MAAYRFFNPAPVFFNLLGLEPIAGGSLQFYSINTTTPKNTWSNETLTILNANPVPLDGGGRANTDIFLDGDYTVVCKDAGGSTIWTRDVISGAVAGQTIPALVNGQFLSNDGANLLWAAIRQLPDATASTGQVPVTNGGGPAGYTLQTLTTLFPSTISFPTGGVKLSNGTTAKMIQVGDGSCASTGDSVAFGSISFATPFLNPPQVFVTLTSRSNPAGGIASYLVNTITTSGAQLIVDTNAFNNTTQPTTFSFLAFGDVAP